MAMAYENLIKDLKLAIQQLEQLTKVASSMYKDQLIDLAYQITSLVVELTALGIPNRMKGLEIAAALKGIMNTTSLDTVSVEDKMAIRSLLDIMNLCLFTPTYK
ncbi:TPA: hypothetical protein ACH3X1_007388 [Trebouxia sp. C0004]